MMGYSGHLISDSPMTGILFPSTHSNILQKQFYKWHLYLSEKWSDFVIECCVVFFVILLLVLAMIFIQIPSSLHYKYYIIQK